MKLTIRSQSGNSRYWTFSSILCENNQCKVSIVTSLNTGEKQKFSDKIHNFPFWYMSKLGILFPFLNVLGRFCTFPHLGTFLTVYQNTFPLNKARVPNYNIVDASLTIDGTTGHDVCFVAWDVVGCFVEFVALWVRLECQELDIEDPSELPSESDRP